MGDNRYLELMDRDFNNYHKFEKCYYDPCHSKEDDYEAVEDDYDKIKYYNHKDVKQKRKDHDKKYSQELEKQKMKNDNHCKGCICNHLKRLEPGTLVDVFLSNGSSFINLFFLHFDNQSCSVYFLEIGATAMRLMIDCEKIEAIRN
ncbi:hypothetical protein ACQKNB_20855 [Lysinibacillus xylanilyticus]|uniref:hypothetical protein n=1 Tax=Lysinibacillus xylanilyticus TaxID=582475 RepID=UPI003D037D86